MAKLVDLQIRRVPAALRERLRRRAKGKGMSMSAYVIERLSEDLERPTIDEWLDEVKAMPPIQLPPGVTGATIIREAREELERDFAAKMDRVWSREKPEEPS